MKSINAESKMSLARQGPLEYFRYPSKLGKVGKTRLFFVLLIILDIFYLLAEFIFNFKLISLFSSGLTQDELQAIERLGIILSGYGLAALVASLLYCRKRTVLHNVLILIALVAVFVPIMNYFQSEIANKIADNSTPQERARAEMLINLRDGLGVGLSEFQELPSYNETDRKELGLIDSAQKQTYFGLLPFMLIHSDKVEEDLRSSAQQWYPKIAVFNMRVPTYYLYKQVYMPLSQQLGLILGGYNKALNKHRALTPELDYKANLLTTQVNEVLERTWMQYINIYLPNSNLLPMPNDDGYIKSIIYLNKQFRLCSSDDCDENYKRKVLEQIIRHYRWHVGFLANQVSDFENPLDILSGMDKQPSSSKLIMANTDKYITSVWNTNVKASFGLRDGVALLNDPLFQRNYLNFPWGNTTFHSLETIKRDLIIAQIRYESSREGISIPADLKPLTEPMFLSGSQISDKFKSVMGRHYFPITTLEMSWSEFWHSYMSQNQAQIANVKMNNLQTNTLEFEGKRAEEGKAFIKAVYMPLISIVLSIVLSTFTIVRIIYLVSLIESENGRVSGKTPKQKKTLGFLAACAMLFLPLIVSVGQFSSAESLHTLEIVNGGPLSIINLLVFKFILNTQPVFMWIGLLLDSVINL